MPTRYLHYLQIIALSYTIVVWIGWVYFRFFAKENKFEFRYATLSARIQKF